MFRTNGCTYFLNRFAVGQVVCDDLSQLGEVPAVPLSAPHDVVVELLVQVVQEGWGSEGGGGGAPF